MDHRLVDVVGALHRPRHHQRAVGLEPGGHRVALDVDVLLVAGPVGALHPHLGGGERRLDVALAELQLGERRPGARPGRLLQGQDRRQRCVVHLHRRRRPQRVEPGTGRHQRHRLADVAHLAGGEDRPGVVEELNAVGARQVGGGDAHRAGGSAIGPPADGVDSGVRVRTADGGAVDHPGKSEVVGVPGLPGDLGQPVRARGALSDRMHGRRPRRSAHHSGSQSPSLTPEPPPPRCRIIPRRSTIRCAASPPRSPPSPSTPRPSR